MTRSTYAAEPGTYLAVWPIENEDLSLAALKQEALEPLRQMLVADRAVPLGLPEFEIVEGSAVVDTRLALVARLPSVTRKDWQVRVHGPAVAVVA